jgi:hypothetical protein
MVLGRLGQKIHAICNFKAMFSKENYFLSFMVNLLRVQQQILVDSNGKCSQFLEIRINQNSSNL